MSRRRLTPWAVRRRLRKEILSERGLVTIRVPPASNPESTVRMKKLVSEDMRYNHLKTDLMRLLELDHGRPIEVLLTLSHNMSDVARQLGVDRSTVLRWKRRLGL